MDYRFQIDLRGIIELLSNHLYSGPQVFLRELLQNAVDAVRARAAKQPGHAGKIDIELVRSTGKGPPTLAMIDNGIGLTEEEIHRFLATIGQSSKRADGWDRPTDFIGQFGIGLLSGFVVADEIVVVTRSIQEGSPAMEWRGRPDGTYTVRRLEHDPSPGTQVYLSAKSAAAEYFAEDRVADLTAHFGSLLPFPIRLTVGGRTRQINEDGPPWRSRNASREEQSRALLDYGRQTFGQDFLDCVPLRSGVGEVDGVAYILPFSPSLATRRTHRVYLKNMLLSETAENLVPDWAFFVKCVVNANDLRPTASREAFYEDEKLAAARQALGRCLRDHLVHLAASDPARLERLVALHYLSIKALAVQDDEFYRLFIDWLPFETSLGTMSLGEYRKRYPVVQYVARRDEFRQIAQVAAAQSQCVINGGYVYDEALLQKVQTVYPDCSVELLDPSTLAQSFDELSLEEREQVFSLVRTADRVLQPFRCGAEIKKFLPAELPTLYSTNAEAGFLRSVEQSREVADPFWSSVLNDLTASRSPGTYAQLCFNYRNALVRRLAAVKDQALLQRAIQMLYVQALLLGHHPLNAGEMALLNDGLLALVEWGIQAQEKDQP